MALQWTVVSHYTGEQIKTKKMLSGIFHLIPLYWGSLIPKWKAFLPNQVQFSRNLGFFRWFLTFIYKIFINFFAPFVRFIVLKTFVLNTRFQRKNRFEKRTTLGWDICKNVFQHGMPNQTTNQYCFFLNISAQTGSFFKPIFALKPCVQDGRFEYNKRYKPSKKNYENFGPWTSKITSKTLNCGKTGPDWAKRLFI